MLLNGGQRNTSTRDALKCRQPMKQEAHRPLRRDFWRDFAWSHSSQGVWLWLEVAVTSWLTTLRFSSYFLSHPWFFFLFVPIHLFLLEGFFILATFSPFEYFSFSLFITSWVFSFFFLFVFISLLCSWLCYSLFDDVNFSPVCLPKYLFFILRCFFALPRGAQRPEMQ